MSNVIHLKGKPRDVDKRLADSVHVAITNACQLAEGAGLVFAECIRAEAQLAKLDASPERELSLKQIRGCQDTLFQALIQLNHCTRKFADATAKSQQTDQRLI